MRKRTTIGAALRKKFKSPREALAALGIDARILESRDLAMDYNGIPGGPSEGLEEAEIEMAGDLDTRVERVMDRLRDVAGDKLDDDDLDIARGMIKDLVRDRMRHRGNSRGRDQDLPRNAIGGGAAGGGEGSGFSGRLSEESWRKADARDRRLQAQDERRQRRRADFDDRFNVAARPSGWECGLESYQERELRAARAEQALRARRSPERRIAVDAKRATSARSFAERYPGAARIGTA